MSDESITDSVKDVVKERLKNPLWGYIALSWCGFNWQNLAVLFMSKSSVTTRIEQITSAENFYLLYLAAPITVGIVNRPGFPGECFICELRLPDHRFRWKHNKLFLLLPEE
ncbi:hypothetical protein ACJHYR_16035, partial [Escherichia sp. WS1450]